MRNGSYIEVDGKPVPEPDTMKWGRWMGKADRIVAKTDIEADIDVSTVFLGLDHGFDDTVLLYETRVFGGPFDMETDRYTTRDEALQGHNNMVKKIR